MISFNLILFLVYIFYLCVLFFSFDFIYRIVDDEVSNDTNMVDTPNDSQDN